MSPAREAHLLTQVPTLDCLAELGGFKARIVEENGALTTELVRALELRAAKLMRREA